MSCSLRGNVNYLCKNGTPYKFKGVWYVYGKQLEFVFNFLKNVVNLHSGVYNRALSYRLAELVACKTKNTKKS